MSSEHVEVLWAMLRKCVNERLARKSADREAAALAAAIEALKSAPQPPAEAQPVGEVKLHGGLLYGQLDRDLPQGTKIYAHPPPSAPVGVEGHVKALSELRDTGDVTDWRLFESALDAAIATLAQQPSVAPERVERFVANIRSLATDWKVREPGDDDARHMLSLGFAAMLDSALENFDSRLNAVAQQPAAEAQPGEWVLVPRVPTDAMLDAMHGRIQILCDPAERTADIQNDAEVWGAMLTAAPQQPAAVDEDWRKKAAEWLEAKAVEQEAANQRWPKHAACYKEWRDRPGILRHLAFQVLAAQPGGSDNDR